MEESEEGSPHSTVEEAVKMEKERGVKAEKGTLVYVEGVGKVKKEKRLKGSMRKRNHTCNWLPNGCCGNCVGVGFVRSEQGERQARKHRDRYWKGGEGR